MSINTQIITLKIIQVQIIRTNIIDLSYNQFYDQGFFVSSTLYYSNT